MVLVHDLRDLHLVVRAKALAACGVVVRRPDEIAARRSVLQQNRKHLFRNVPFQYVAQERYLSICLSFVILFLGDIIPNPHGAIARILRLTRTTR